MTFCHQFRLFASHYFFEFQLIVDDIHCFRNSIYPHFKLNKIIEVNRIVEIDIL